MRASFGLSNSADDVEVLCKALEAISRRRFDAGYVLDPERGEYTHPRFSSDFALRFRF